MTTPAIEVMVSGRIVCGHPITRRPVTKKDPVTKQETPLMDPTTNLQITESYFAVAVPKGAEPDWKQSPWGQQIYTRACQDWPNGEHGALDFSWKITDGDSMVPNKNQKKPAEREGWPGHWVIHCTTRFAVRCYHAGKYDPTQQIQEENAIKCGDYCRVLLDIKGNSPSQSPGVYVNPMLFELSRAGVLIVTDSGPSAAAAFGGGGGVITAPVAPAAPVTPAAPVAPVVPAPDLLHPGQTQPAPPPAPPVAEVKYRTTDGGIWTEAQLLAASYTLEMIAALPRV